MRILFWSETFRTNINGGELIAAALVRDLRRLGHQLLVITRKDRDDQPDQEWLDDVPIHRFPFYLALARRQADETLQIQQRVAALRRSFGPDLVHVHFNGPSWFFLNRTAAAPPAPLLVTLAEGIPNAFAAAGTLFGTTIRAADRVITSSQAMRRELLRQLPELAPRLSVLLYGRELPALAPTPLPFSPPRLLGYGRLEEKKGFGLAIEAFAEIRRQRSDALLTIAGNGEARPALQRRAAELGLTGSIDFPGWVAPSEVPALLNRSTLVLVPSRWEEPFGLVALEPAQMARPVIASRVGGLPEVVLDGQTGLLFEREDASGLVQAVSPCSTNQRSRFGSGRPAASERSATSPGHHTSRLTWRSTASWCPPSLRPDSPERAGPADE